MKSSKVRAWGVVICAALLATAIAKAQKTSAPTASAQGQTKTPAAFTPLRATTRLVQVSVVVHDKHGNPVPGLTKDDFTLLDDKKPQTIQMFSLASRQPVAPPNSATAGSAIALTPDTYTNRAEQRGGAPTSVTVILIDGVNTRPADLAYARKYVVKFLGQIQPQDRVAVYWFAGDIHVIHDFTSDAQSLVAAVSSAQNATTHHLDASTPQSETAPGFANAQAEGGMNSNSPESEMNSNSGEAAGLQQLVREMQLEANFYIEQRARVTADAMIAIAKHIGYLPGRKNLIWVSGSFPLQIGFDSTGNMLDARNFESYVVEAAQAMSDANIAIYPVDARGLIIEGPDLSRSAGPMPRRPITTPAFHGPNPLELFTMDEMAQRTGGRAFYNSNDIYGAIRAAVDDSTLTYTLGYYPSGVQWDGRFHNISVKVDRAGVEVRARKGYFAELQNPATPQAGNADVLAAARSPIEASDIGIFATAQASDIPGAQALNVDLHFDLHDVDTHEEGGRWKGALQIVFVQVGANDHALSAVSETINLNLDPNRYKQLLDSGASFSRMIPVLPGATQVSVVLKDKSNGNIGSVDIPLGKYFASARTVQQARK